MSEAAAILCAAAILAGWVLLALLHGDPAPLAILLALFDWATG